MSVGYIVPIDPNELANRFSYSIEDEIAERLGELDPQEEEEDLDNLWSIEDFEKKVVPLLDKIPPKEADLIELYFSVKKRQADIATMFEVTQAAVSYRLNRGIQRIKFLLELPNVEHDTMRRDLNAIFDSIDVEILMKMFETTCQSTVAEDLELTQGRVRHRFFKAIETLKGLGESSVTYEPYYKIFALISDKNFNILKSVELPQWSNRGQDSIW